MRVLFWAKTGRLAIDAVKGLITTMIGKYLHPNNPPASNVLFIPRYPLQNGEIRLSASLFVLLAVMSPFSSQAGMNDQLQSMFTDMINVTPGEAYQSQRRGVITGGNMVMRNRIAHPNLIAFVPPGVKAGCGGIDLFGGSFSFINGEQFTQLMRNVAQNAVGYAFQLAIEGMCPTCAQVMTKLQKDVQFINSLMRNSCEAAKTAVNWTGLKAWSEEREHEAASIDASQGYLEDYFKGKEGSQPPAKVVIQNGAANELTGNIVKKALTDASVADWYSNGDEQLEMALMSLTGTLIITTKSDNTDLEYHFEPPIIKVRDFIEGGSVQIYDCDNADTRSCSRRKCWCISRMCIAAKSAPSPIFRWASRCR